MSKNSVIVYLTGFALLGFGVALVEMTRPPKQVTDPAVDRALEARVAELERTLYKLHNRRADGVEPEATPVPRLDSNRPIVD